MILFLVRSNKYVTIVSANGRETAKTSACKVLLGNPDKYEVTPLTKEDDIVSFNMVVNLT